MPVEKLRPWKIKPSYDFRLLKLPTDQEKLLQLEVRMRTIEGIDFIPLTLYSPRHDDPTVTAKGFPSIRLGQNVNVDLVDYLKSNEIPNTIVGVQRIREISGSVVVEEGVEAPLHVTICEPIAWINAKQFPIEEALGQSAPSELMGRFKDEGIKKVVLTRAGTWEPFEEDETVINIPPKDPPSLPSSPRPIDLFPLEGRGKHPHPTSPPRRAA